MEYNPAPTNASNKTGEKKEKREEAQSARGRARKEARLPPAVYADALKQVGVDIAPDELIERASFDFAEVRDEMQVLAKQIAARRRWPSGDYRDVMAKLKSRQLTPLAVLPRYWQRLREIEAIVRREKLVSVPERKPVVRLATDAESAQMSAPSFPSAQPSASVSSIRLANSGGVNTSSFDRLAIQLSTSGLRPRSVKLA